MDMNNSFVDERMSSSEQEIELEMCDRSVVSELSSDFSLSDYQPEIKRLLRVTASMLPPTKYFGAGQAEFAGNIDYYVLYMGADNEIYCAPLSGEYSVSLPIDKDDYIDLGDQLITDVKIVPDMISGRVTSPRHITVKCRLKTNAKIYGRGKVMSTVTACDGSVEKLKGDVQNMRMCLGVGDTINLTDEIIPDMRDGEFRVVCADGRVLVNEVSGGKDEVICRGELNLKLMISRENGDQPTVSTRRIPFSNIIACEGVTPESAVCAKGTLSELTLTVDEGRILVEAGVIIEVTGQTNRTVTYISDIYSTKNACECNYRELNVSSSVAGFNRNFTFSESLPLENTQISEGVTVVDACGNSVIEDYKFENGKCKMLGKCKFNLQFYDGNDYAASELEMPFKYEYDMPEGVYENVKCTAEPSVISCRARLDGERIGVDAEISVCGRMWDEKKCVILESYRLGEELGRNSGEIIVCYPSRNDTLWSVGKKYNASIVDLCRVNKLPQNTAPDEIILKNVVDYVVI